jgi:hypothetical protein
VKITRSMSSKFYPVFIAHNGGQKNTW